MKPETILSIVVSPSGLNSIIAIIDNLRKFLQRLKKATCLRHVFIDKALEWLVNKKRKLIEKQTRKCTKL